MKFSDAIREAMKKKGITQKQLASMIGAKGQTVIAARLAHKALSVDNFVDMLNALGYDLVVMERKPGPKPAGAMVIETSDEFKAVKEKKTE